MCIILASLLLIFSILFYLTIKSKFNESIYFKCIDDLYK